MQGKNAEQLELKYLELNATWCRARLTQATLHVPINNDGKPEFNQEVLVHTNVINRTIDALEKLDKLLKTR